MSTSQVLSVLCNPLRVPSKSNHSTLPTSGRTFGLGTIWMEEGILKLRHGIHSLMGLKTQFPGFFTQA